MDISQEPTQPSTRLPPGASRQENEKQQLKQLLRRDKQSFVKSQIEQGPIKSQFEFLRRAIIFIKLQEYKRSPKKSQRSLFSEFLLTQKRLMNLKKKQILTMRAPQRLIECINETFASLFEAIDSRDDELVEEESEQLLNLLKEYIEMNNSEYHSFAMHEIKEIEREVTFEEKVLNKIVSIRSSLKTKKFEQQLKLKQKFISREVTSKQYPSTTVSQSQLSSRTKQNSQIKFIDFKRFLEEQKPRTELSDYDNNRKKDIKIMLQYFHILMDNDK